MRSRVAVYLLYWRATTGNEVPDDRYHCKYQQDVNQAAANRKCEEAECPENDEYKCDTEKHWNLSSENCGRTPRCHRWRVEILLARIIARTGS